MKLAIAIPYNPLLERGGLQNLALRIGWLLSKHNESIEVRILSLGPSGAIKGIRIEGFSSLLPLLFDLHRQKFGAVHWMELWDSPFEVYMQLAYSLLWLRKNKIRTVLTTATPSNLRRKTSILFGSALARISFDVYAVSGVEILNEYLAASISRDKIAIVKQPISFEDFVHNRCSRRVEKKYTILYIGRLIKRKGVRLLLEFWHQYYRSSRDVILKIVGTSYHHRNSIDSEIYEYVSSRRLTNVHFQPNVPDPYCEIIQSDVVIVPSTSDGQAYAVLEAMVSNVPVITSDIPPFQEFAFDGETAFVFNLGNNESLQHAIISSKNAYLRRRVVTNARHYVLKEHDGIKLYNRYMALYN